MSQGCTTFEDLRNSGIILIRAELRPFVRITALVLLLVSGKVFRNILRQSVTLEDFS